MKSSMSAHCPDNRSRLSQYKSPAELNSRSLGTDVEGDERCHLVTSAKIGLGLHWAYQGVIYKELVGIDGKKRNRLIYLVVESLEVQFSPLLCLTMCWAWLLKGVGTDVRPNCLSNSGQEGGEDATWAGLKDSEGSSCDPSVECFVLGAVQTGRLASHQCLPSPVSHACRPLWLALPLSTPTPPRLPWRWRLLHRWLAADVRDNAHQTLVIRAAHEPR